MEYRTLGRSGLKVSAVSLGCWAIGGPSWRDGGAVGGSGNSDDSLAGLRRDHEVGINHLDENAPASAPALMADEVAFVKQTLQG